MYVNLWAFTKGNHRVMAVIRANGGEMQIEAKEPIPLRIQESIEKTRKARPDDEAFLRILPVEFTGSYYRAELIED